MVALYELVPVRLLPFCLLPFRLLPFRLKSGVLPTHKKLYFKVMSNYKLHKGNMYKEYLHTLMSKHCSNVVLLLYCIFNTSFIFKTLYSVVLQVGKTPLFVLK